ncbi:hypothetical protein P12x_006035 (plasmid) [Tundrisphaera lichenicola]|uniref:hypothetical protein n=1 Tax=Tundrisphaera lichenicola TaxID=2029860 RepID=UPI003EB87B2E
MDGTLLLAEVIDGRWRPAIGDPTVVGWVTVVAYLLAAAACARAAWREPMPGGRRRSRPSGFWLTLSVAMLLLGINKQIDLQTLFTLLGRRILKANGLHQDRRTYQALFLGCVAASSLLLLIVSLWLARRSFRHRWLALVGMAFLMGFVVIRAASFHHVDTLLASQLGGLKWNWILELGGIVVVAAGAIRVRPAGLPSSDSQSAEKKLLNYLYRTR